MSRTKVNTWISGDHFTDTIDQIMNRHFPDRMPKAVVGWNGIIIWDKGVDPVNMLEAWIHRMAEESCGECTPCREGTQQLIRMIDAV